MIIKYNTVGVYQNNVFIVLNIPVFLHIYLIFK